MDQALEEKRVNLRVQDKRSAQYQIQEKRTKFERLKTSYHKNISEIRAHKSEMLSKRRGKRFLGLALIDR